MAPTPHNPQGVPPISVPTAQAYIPHIQIPSHLITTHPNHIPTNLTQSNDTQRSQNLKPNTNNPITQFQLPKHISQFHPQSSNIHNKQKSHNIPIRISHQSNQNHQQKYSQNKAGFSPTRATHLNNPIFLPTTIGQHHSTYILHPNLFFQIQSYNPPPINRPPLFMLPTNPSPCTHQTRLITQQLNTTGKH